MSLLENRIKKLEDLMSGACACSARPMWIRALNHDSEFLPDIHTRPPAIDCPRHGRTEPGEIHIRGIDPKRYRTDVAGVPAEQPT